MKFQFLVEIDLKTLCHGRDENQDEVVLTHREVQLVVREVLRGYFDRAMSDLPLTHILHEQNVIDSAISFDPAEQDS